MTKLKYILLIILVPIFITTAQADNPYPTSQVIPIIDGCQKYALEYIEMSKSNGIVNYEYKKDIFSPEFLPKIIGYLYVTETELSKGKNIPAAIGYNIISTCMPTIPTHITIKPGSFNQLGKILKNSHSTGYKDMYISVNKEQIKLYTVNKVSKQ